MRIPFSWESAIKSSEKIKIANTILQLKNGNEELKIKYPAEFKDAVSDNPNYRELNKRIKEETFKRAEKIERRKTKVFEKRVKRVMNQ